MNLQELLESLISLPSTVIAYYDDLYGYPWGRMKLAGMLCLGFAFWLAVLNLTLTSY
ncbi:MAG: hypothetical protein V7K57_16175 [Nostoc sp.]|uniref:hypothetical protein n=1 Tax=Nostoc sp. TaxID=1180 RepID=UPI002FF7E923